MENGEKIGEGKKKDYLLPISIVIAALLIGGALVWSVGKKSEVQNLAENQVQEEDPNVLAENIVPVSSSDHILGDKDASIKVVTFTDFECPFCKEFHKTLEKTLLQYDGQVAVVYRQFPLPQLHAYAYGEAKASECAAELGGEKGFWDYVSKIFETTKSNDGLDPELLPKLAGDIGLDTEKFSECIASDRHDGKIQANIEDGINSGARGTPYSIIITPKNKYYVPGAFPFEESSPGGPSFKAIIEEALKDIE